MRRISRRDAGRRVVLRRSPRLQGNAPITYDEPGQQTIQNGSPPYSPQTSPGSFSGGSPVDLIGAPNTPHEETVASVAGSPMAVDEAASDDNPQEETGFFLDDNEMETEGAFSDDNQMGPEGADSNDSTSEETAYQMENAIRGSQYVASLPTVPRLTLGNDEPEQHCGICYEAYSEDPVMLPCRHQFDSQCLLYWLSEAHSGQNTCPVCRRELFPRQRDYDEDADFDVNNGMTALISVDLFRPLTLRNRQGHLRPNFREIRELMADNRRLAVLEDHSIYRRLVDDGAPLVPLRPRTAVLTAEEDRALFQELRLRGAFNMPGMDRQFRYRHPSQQANEMNRDEDIYEVLRNSGAQWCVDHNSWRINDYHPRFE